jgi:transposase-like protein
MGQILHKCARTTEALRRAIQDSEESIAALADRYGLNPKTVHKWKRRKFAHDVAMGPKNPRSTVLSAEEEAIAVAFRQMTLLPLDDCLYTLQSSIPKLTRSALHRCFKRHGVSRLPEIEGDKPRKKKFKTYPIGYFHIDIAEVQTEEGKLYMFVGIDRTSKFAYAELHQKSDRTVAAAFLQSLIAAVPYKIHTILTDNGIQFCHPPRYRNGPTAQYIRHMFGMRCDEHGIEHRMTKPKHPWTNGQVERMNRTIKDATVKKYYYQSHDELKKHLHTFLMAYNFAKRLKVLKGLTAYEYVCKIWTKEPERFRINPLHHTVGLNT